MLIHALLMSLLLSKFDASCDCPLDEQNDWISSDYFDCWPESEIKITSTSSLITVNLVKPHKIHIKHELNSLPVNVCLIWL